MLPFILITLLSAVDVLSFIVIRKQKPPMPWWSYIPCGGILALIRYYKHEEPYDTEVK